MGTPIGAGLTKAAIFTAPWHKPATIFRFPLICPVVMLLLRGLYRGRKWAFWLIVPLTVFGSYNATDTLSMMAPGAGRIMFLGQGCSSGACSDLPLSHPHAFDFIHHLRNANKSTQQTVMSPALWVLLGSSPRLMPAADFAR